ncbi:MAG: ribosomal protein S18-alanine N-acetyltransferase [Polaromonas sp.]
MSAVFKPADSIEARFEPMTHAALSQVASVEQSAYKFPWTRGNFSDSLNAGYEMQMLVGGQATPELLGYFVAMKGVDEVHLLNITVAPTHQLQGWGRLMLDALALWSRGQGAQWLWLEVRASNAHAKGLYERYGFREVGLRKGYYPEGGTSLLGTSAREDAVVMSLSLAGSAA